MKYSVISTPFAEYQLADIWLRAVDRRAVTEASDRIDGMLRNDPDQVGELRPDGRRAVIVPPLMVTFEVRADDRQAIIVSVRYLP